MIGVTQFIISAYLASSSCTVTITQSIISLMIARRFSSARRSAILSPSFSMAIMLLIDATPRFIAALALFSLAAFASASTLAFAASIFVALAVDAFACSSLCSLVASADSAACTATAHIVDSAHALDVMLVRSSNTFLSLTSCALMAAICASSIFLSAITRATMLPTTLADMVCNSAVRSA